MAGIYIHIPFCNKKCAYCNFYSTARLKDLVIFLDALTKEITLRRNECAEIIETIYFGGGTPTLLSIKQLESILYEIPPKVGMTNGKIEITIEANPEQLNENYLIGLKELGFNRISIGVQSFNDKVLQFLGRTHNAKQAIAAIETAHKVGFENISIDLIYGIYIREENEWATDLQTAFSLPIKHLSAYALTIEENTLLAKKMIQNRVPKEDEDAVLLEFESLRNLAKQNHFEHYEISNFALEGYDSKHNSNYWNGTHYIGFGASAHSYNGISRRWNVAHISEYCKLTDSENPIFEEELLTETDQFNEMIMLGLRTKNGVNLSEVEKKFGKDILSHLYCSLNNIDNNLYIIENEQLQITAEGLFVVDNITRELFFLSS